MNQPFGSHILHTLWRNHKLSTLTENFGLLVHQSLPQVMMNGLCKLHFCIICVFQCIKWHNWKTFNVLAKCLLFQMNCTKTNTFLAIKCVSNFSWWPVPNTAPSHWQSKFLPQQIPVAGFVSLQKQCDDGNFSASKSHHILVAFQIWFCCSLGTASIKHLEQPWTNILVCIWHCWVWSLWWAFKPLTEQGSLGPFEPLTEQGSLRPFKPLTE